MLPRRDAARNGLCWGTFSLVTALSVLAVSGETSFARSHHQQHATSPSASESAGDEPRYSDIVVDGNTGTVLHASSPDGLRHPASLTKIMTLYLLFEQLEAGRLKLDSALQVSEHAAEQSPTKLGLRDGQTIKVEDAIKGIVTRSANDAAVVVAENIAGDEESFAKLMTRKAQTLGMAHTVYRNASGLPSEEQVTTARDQALLGRAIQERFPRYYKYFSTRVFEFRGEEIGNHNRLLGSVEGVDGIKTGYIAASGFNLVTSVHRDNRFLLAVVFGGSSAGSRDERMRELIRENIAQASVQHTATMVADAESKPENRIESRSETKAEPKSASKPASKPAQVAATTVPVTLTATKPDAKPETKPAPAFALASAESVPVTLPAKPEAKAAPKQEGKEAKPATYAVASAGSVAVTLTSKSDPGASTTVQVPRWAASSAASAPKVAPVVGSEDPIHPVPVRTVLVRAGSSVQTAAIAPVQPPAAPAAAELAPAPAAAPANQPAPVAKPAVLPFPPPGTRPSGVSGLPSNITTGSVAEPPPAAAPAAAAAPPPIAPAPSAASVVAAPAPPAAPAAPAAPPVTHVGWMIQVGAFPAEGEAKQRLSSVQTRASRYLASADAYTETVSKGDSVLYRARFAGLAKDQAEAACAFLKHNDVECMTVKN